MEFFKEEIRSEENSHRYQAPTMYCKLFKDKSAALEIAKVPKMGPAGTKQHITNIKYHHFRKHVY